MVKLSVAFAKDIALKINDLPGCIALAVTTIRA